MLELAQTVLFAYKVSMIGLGQGFRGSRFHSRLDCIGDAYLGENRLLRQTESKIWGQIGNYLGK